MHGSKRVRVVIEGRVQGVGFRWYCREEAAERGVGGFVRNLPDGRVEAAFEGDPAAVDGMVQWCSRGPSFAIVREIEVQEEPPTGQDEFRIAR